MAEQAQKEPTMEEILSSIRKIIADDDTQVEPVETAAETNLTPVEDDLDVFGDVNLQDEDTFLEAAPETEDDVMAAISQSMDEVTAELEAEAKSEPVLEPIDEPSFDVEDDFDFEVDEDSFETELQAEPASLNDFLVSEDDGFEAIEEVTEDPIEDVVETLVQPEPQETLIEETPMTASAPLSDAATVGAAAGSLGKLLSKVEFGEDAGGNTTIEGVVREMLRPMLKEWLDDNLPGIVEKHVEAEVQRIARMAG